MWAFLSGDEYDESDFDFGFTIIDSNADDVDADIDLSVDGDWWVEDTIQQSYVDDQTPY